MTTLTTRLSVVSFTVVAIALAACGKPSGDKPGQATTTSAKAPKGGSCMEENAGLCSEYNDNPLGMAEGACTGMFKGKYAKTACPTENLMGICEKKDEKEFYYFGNSQGAWVEDAKKDCEKSITPGKWIAQPNVEQAAKDKAIPAASHIAGSCTKKNGQCDDHHGRSLGDLAKSMCESGGDGTWATTPCPTAEVVGSCVKHGKVSRYYPAALKSSKVKELKTDCEDAISEGHWYPGPAAPANEEAAPAAAKVGAKQGAAAKGAGTPPAKGGTSAPAAKKAK